MNESGDANTVVSTNLSLQYPKDELIEDKLSDDGSMTVVFTTTNAVMNQKYDKNSTGISSTAMSNSIASILDDSTPSDSGVQLLDSISSGMNESFMSSCGLDYDGNNAALPQLPSQSPAIIECVSNTVSMVKQPQCYIDDLNGTVISILPDVVMATSTEISRSNAHCLDIDEIAMTKSDIDNSNVEADYLNAADSATDIPDEMKTSICSTFDTDAIVFRRKVKKTRTDSTSSTGGSVKKRVSFHEDILKNTKTDNIHIEHGFITYKGYAKKTSHRFLRNSWCSQGNCDDYEDEVGNTCYRNACSDVLDYGKTDLYEAGDNDIIPYDNSGVFEYVPQPNPPHIEKAILNEEHSEFYHCKCSSSNSSLESSDNANGNPIKRTDYGRAKSSSCDCIGLAESNKLNNNGSPNMTDNCYFSEPCIETMDESFETICPKSVWRKEMKPKGSCLKKNVRETGVILEHDINAKVKTFNVHQLSDMNNLFGSLKNIFSIPLPERGVPEGCEDLQTVYECVPETDAYSPIKKLQMQNLELTPTKGIVSLESMGQLKRKAKLSLFPIPAEDEMVHVAIADDTTHIVQQAKVGAPCRPNTFRNKFIVNCESTVFEHTGVFYENKDAMDEFPDIPSSSSVSITPQKPSKSILSFSTAPFKQKLSNIFQSFRDTSSTATQQPTKLAPISDVQVQLLEQERQQQEQLQAQLKKLQEEQMIKSWAYSGEHRSKQTPKYPYDGDSMGTSSMTSSMISNLSDKNSMMSSSTITSSTNTTSNQGQSDQYNLSTPNLVQPTSSNSNSSSPTRKTRHLASPLRRKSANSKFDRSKLSPDLFCVQKAPPNPMLLLSEEFDDLLTITTTTTETELNDNEIEVIDYSAVVEPLHLPNVDQPMEAPNQFLRPPSSKSSLINRFLRNVTQKKINDATIKKNNILSAKYRDPPKLFNNLYVKPKKPINFEFVADLNAEIAQELQLNSSVGNKEVNQIVKKTVPSVIRSKEEFGIGVGEVCVDIFDINNLHIMRDDKETLIKVFKLYTGYNLQGHMTPVLVFLTDRTLYVTDLVRNRLCNKFVLPYSELDVILIGPHGNTVLLSNSARDMQQVLLAGGPYPADGLVSSLEMCARRAGAVLPAIGQLTLDHLIPLQKFVQENCSVSKNDAWVYYAVVSVPANVFSFEDEPLGPNIKGPLMHRNISFASDQHQPWHAGYFLLKAGVLYMFADSNKKLPSMVIALAECKGARRAVTSPRPHCFEILLKTGTLQLAAPDEYVASEWLQKLVQSASGLFEQQERHKTLGCTLVITSNHLITLREDFSSPLRRLNTTGTLSPAIRPHKESVPRKLSISTTVSDNTFNDTCSNLSTPTKISDLMSSARSSPSRSQQATASGSNEEKSFSSISSIYGKNSGVEVKTCAALQEMVSVRTPAQNDQWWCILEFSCQEVRESSDDMVIFFATNSDMRRFLSILETMWQTKNNAPFPMYILPEDEFISNHGSNLFLNLNKSWESLLSAALGYPQ